MPVVPGESHLVNEDAHCACVCLTNIQSMHDEGQEIEKGSLERG